MKILRTLNQISKYSFMVWTIWSMYSCTQNNSNKVVYYNEDSLIIKKTFDKNGSIQEEETLNKDSLTHGYLKKYFPTGQLKIMTEFTLGKKKGKVEAYYPSGAIEHLGWFNQGEQDSIWIWYYEKGGISQKDSWRDGKCFGSHYKYYPNQMLQEFFFCDIIDGELIYKRVCDSNGIVISEIGKGLSVIYNKNKLKVGENFEVINFTGIPPKVGYNLNLVLKDKLGKVLIEKKVNPENFENVSFGKRYIYDLKLKQPGEFLFLSILYRVDSLNSKQNKDTVSIDLLVE